MPLAVLVHNKLAVLAVLRQNLVMLTLGVDAGRALAKVDFAVNIFQDEVMRVAGVVLVSTQREAHLTVHAHHVGQLEVPPLMLVCGGLTHADEAAALVHKFADGGHDLFVDPILGAAEGGVGIPDVDDDADALGNAVADVIKINELNIERHTAQALQHTFGRVGLAVVNGMMHLVAHPLAQAAPAVEDGHLERRHVGLGALHIFVDLAEFTHHVLNFVDKTRPVAGEL